MAETVEHRLVAATDGCKEFWSDAEYLETMNFAKALHDKREILNKFLRIAEEYLPSSEMRFCRGTVREGLETIDLHGELALKQVQNCIASCHEYRDFFWECCPTKWDVIQYKARCLGEQPSVRQMNRQMKRKRNDLVLECLRAGIPRPC